jgi:hypothetical protein
MKEQTNIFKEILYMATGIYVLYMVGGFVVGLFTEDNRPRRSNSHHYEQEYRETENTEPIVMPHKVQSTEPLYQNPYGSEEPLPSEVREEDQDMYNWITDHPDYNGDWEYWVDEYENSQQQGDEYDDEF